MEQVNKVPIPKEELDRLRSSTGRYNSHKPKAFILGHGLWNDLSLPSTVSWIETILSVITPSSPHEFHGLFITPNAAGKEKPDEFLVTQGNKALMKFEEALGEEARKRELEHLGTWNMSVQARKYDGVHLDMRGNLVKAMMVVNWLNMLEV